MVAQRSIVALLLLAAPWVMAQTVTTLDTGVFQASGDVAVDGDGNIFVADYGVALNNSNGTQVLKITPDGTVSVFATGFTGASGNTFGPDGALYQSNIAVSRIDRIAQDGSVTPFATGAQGVAGPVGLAFDSEGNLFVSNCGNSTMLKLSPDGTSGNVFSNSNLLSCPNGLTIDDDDNLYAANFNNGNIIQLTPDGTASVFASTPGGAAKPSGGNGHIIYRNDRLYVVSNATHQLFEIDMAGNRTLIAGSGARGRADGDGAAAQFSLPTGIDLSPDGTTVYVNDSETINGGNNTIAPNKLRVITLDNIEPTLSINPGLNDAWFNAATDGQGFFINVFPDVETMFVGWFTFETNDRPGAAPAADLGAPFHRWLTAIGGWSGNVATLDVFNTAGGLFDDPTAVDVSEAESYGTLTIEFHDCSTATLDYDLFAIGEQGQIPLTRIVPDNDVLCEALQP